MTSFGSKHSLQYTDLERQFASLCGEIIRTVRPDKEGVMKVAADLRARATQAQKSALNLDTEFGFGHVRMMDELVSLRQGLGTYRAKIRTKRDPILFDSYSFPDIDRVIKDAKNSILTNGGCLIWRKPPRVYRGGGWGDSMEIEISFGVRGEISLQYSELVGDKKVEASHYQAFEDGLARFGLVPVFGCSWYQGGCDWEALCTKAMQGKSGEALRVSVIDHDFGGIQFDFSVGFASIETALDMTRMILEGAHRSPREKLLFDRAKEDLQYSSPEVDRRHGELRIRSGSLSIISAGRHSIFPLAEGGKAFYADWYFNGTAHTRLLLTGEISEAEYKWGYVREKDLQSIVNAIRKEGITCLMFSESLTPVWQEEMARRVSACENAPSVIVVQRPEDLSRGYQVTVSTHPFVSVGKRILYVQELKDLLCSKG